MRGSNLRVCLLFALLALTAVANFSMASFWFQTGAYGSSKAGFNNGASVSIQTVWQNVSDGSLGFWVGETLSNDAFIQAGYQIVNATGEYPTSCNMRGCNGNTTLTAGEPTWFWEYFPADGGNDTFYGGIGSDGSAGLNGTFNNYTFRSNGNVWTAYFNNVPMGSVNLGASQSGINSPTAIGELADTSIGTQTMQKVIFGNLQFYANQSPEAVPMGYSLISYWKGSDTLLANPYGVEEIGNRVNYFEVGSGLPQQNRSTLWEIGYSLRVVSPYGNIAGLGDYMAYSTVALHAPRAVNLSNGTRAYFAGWVGKGQNSYTGSNINATVDMYANITETAVWNVQYYVGVNSSYNVVGSGWYNANSTATLRAKSMIDLGNGTRVVFAGWSNGADTNSTAISVNAPATIDAEWTTQYRINATTPYGGITGAGWYNRNGMVTLRLNQTFVPVGSGTQLGFYGWSNGYSNSTMSFAANAPQSISAVFRVQHLVTLELEDVFGNVVAGADYYDINGADVHGSSTYLFEGVNYTVDYTSYKGVKIPLNYPFVVRMPETLRLEAPLYEVQISAVSAFDTPVDASVNLTFDNGTNLVSNLGSTGTVSFEDVPYGHVYGYVEYLGIKRNIDLSGGTIKILFITPSLIAVTIIAIAAAVLSGRFVRNQYSDGSE